MTTPAKPPPCGFTFDGKTCRKRDAHRCAPRVAHVVGFFVECLRHTKGPKARRPFVPSPWQRTRILAPLFGEVVWSTEHSRYVRRYRTLYLLIARKNGKTELIAGCMLYLLVADGEESAEVYGFALDKDQAAIAWRAAARMVDLSPVLRSRIVPVRSKLHMADRTSDSIFDVAAGDDLGNLGPNPSAWYIDELLTQRSRDLYDAVRFAAGARVQPVTILATTGESDPYGFAAQERDWSARVLLEPELDPTRLVVMFECPRGDDWRRVSSWRKANPALGDFLSTDTLREECNAAQGNPAGERSFRQFRLNQRPRGAGTKAIAPETWDRLPRVDAGGPPGAEDAFVGCRSWVGIDLASTSDLAAVAHAVEGPDGLVVLWRHWIPEDGVGALVQRTAGLAEVWIRDGWLTVTEGNVLDYSAVRGKLVEDRRLLDIQEVAFDPWGMTQLSAELVDDGFAMVEHRQGFASMAAPTKEILRLVKSGGFSTTGDPVARWEGLNVVLRSDPAGNLKPDKGKSVDKIDGFVAATMAVGRFVANAGKPKRRSAYASRDLVVVS